jgi:hypothetical protein
MLVLAALALTACESSQEENARLEKVAKQEARHRAPSRRGLSIARESTRVKVLGAKAFSDSEGAAVVVTLRNTSATALRSVPIEITVKDSSGATTYTNTTPGLAPGLTSMPLMPAHATINWVNDQVQASSASANVRAKVGEGEPVSEATPSLEATGVHLNEGAAEGTLVDHAQTARHEVVLYVVARRDGTVVAAGSALIAQAEANTSSHFQAFLTGHPAGAKLEVDVSPGSSG